jgi:tetraacyldisaccharide 4'-kinase
VSSAFRLILRAREKLYSSGILTAMRLHHPVISVGNLTVGGTGKTPLVIALAEGLRSRGFHPVILSRGYGRTSRGICIVGNQQAHWETWGDEPLLMKQRLGNVPVVVGANRYEAGLLAERKDLGNIFLLDDGFQHRRLHRDVDIVTVDPVEWAAGEMLLPIGRWREPKAAITRAHAACVQDSAGDTPDLPIPSFRVRTEIEGIFTGEAPVPTESFKNRAVVAFAGIAKPERFFAALESVGIRPVRCVRFPDHYHYSARDVHGLGGEMLITTEKDAARLATVAGRPYSYLRISAKIPDFEDLMSLISSRLQLACK